MKLLVTNTTTINSPCVICAAVDANPDVTDLALETVPEIGCKEQQGVPRLNMTT